MDDFEQHLRRQPIAPPPTNWRDGILEAARQGRTGFQPVSASVSERPCPTNNDPQDLTGSLAENDLNFQPVTERSAIAAPVREQTAISGTDDESIEVGRTWQDRRQIVETSRASTKDRLEACPTLLAALHGWLWPHPGAWAALASVWVFIFFMNHQIQVDVQHDIELAGVKAPASDVLNAFEERRLAVEHFLASGDFELPVLDRPPALKPRRTGSPPLMLLTT